MLKPIRITTRGSLEEVTTVMIDKIRIMGRDMNLETRPILQQVTILILLRCHQPFTTAIVNTGIQKTVRTIQMIWIPWSWWAERKAVLVRTWLARAKAWWTSLISLKELKEASVVSNHLYLGSRLTINTQQVATSRIIRLTIWRRMQVLYPLVHLTENTWITRIISQTTLETAPSVGIHSQPKPWLACIRSNRARAASCRKALLRAGSIHTNKMSIRWKAMRAITTRKLMSIQTEQKAKWGLNSTSTLMTMSRGQEGTSILKTKMQPMAAAMRLGEMGTIWHRRTPSWLVRIQQIWATSMGNR